MVLSDQKQHCVCSFSRDQQLFLIFDAMTISIGDALVYKANLSIRFILKFALNNNSKHLISMLIYLVNFLLYMLVLFYIVFSKTDLNSI